MIMESLEQRATNACGNWFVCSSAFSKYVSGEIFKINGVEENAFVETFSPSDCSFKHAYFDAIEKNCHQLSDKKAAAKLSKIIESQYGKFTDPLEIVEEVFEKLSDIELEIKNLRSSLKRYAQ